MTSPYLAEIRLISFNFPPKGWALCNGQILPINQNQALFSLLGTTYGGNGQTNFALPNLQGRASMHMGNGHNQGEQGGEAAHTLIPSEMPAHAHQALARAHADASLPTLAHFAASGKNSFATTTDSTMNTQAIGTAGGNQAHNNMPPYLVLNYVIALQGIFPSRN